MQVGVDEAVGRAVVEAGGLEVERLHAERGHGVDVCGRHVGGDSPWFW